MDMLGGGGGGGGGGVGGIIECVYITIFMIYKGGGGCVGWR